MAAARTIHSDLCRVFLLSLVWLFAIPAATLVFTKYALQTEDAAFIQRVKDRISAMPNVSSAQKADEIAFYDTHRLSMACDATGPENREFHDKVCSPYSLHWQFHWAERAAFWTLVLGAALMLAALRRTKSAPWCCATFHP